MVHTLGIHNTEVRVPKLEAAGSSAIIVELPEVVNSQFNSQGGVGIHDPSRSTRYEEPGMGADKITVMGLNSDTEVGNNTNA